MLFAVAPPQIDSLTATPTAIAPGATATIAVAAHDPDCTTGTCTTGCGLYVRADLTQWSATGGSFPATNNGVSGSPYTASATWQAPAVEGTYTITVSLSDSGTFVCGNRQTATASVPVLVTTTTNQPPQVTALTATPAQIFPGGSSALTCTATDPDGDPLTYAWSSDLGTVTPGAPGAATFTATTPGLATVTCTASDSQGAFGSRTVRVSVSAAALDRRLVGALAEPSRLAVDSLGDLFVVDRGSGGILAFHLGNGQPAWQLNRPDASAVAVDWSDRLLVGLRDGNAAVIDRAGRLLLSLPDEERLGEVSDVAVDQLAHRYAVLHRPSGRVVVFDAGGAVVAAFGSTGDAPEQLASPGGIAFTPQGRIVVADSGHAQIKIFEATGAPVFSFGGPGGGIGEFVQLGDVEVDANGIIFASDLYQSWVQAFGPDGTPREVIGTWGANAGRFQTPSGLALSAAFDRLAVASASTPSVEVFILDPNAPPPPVPARTVTPSALSFAEQGVGSQSPPQMVTVANSGSVPLGVRGFRVQGDFAVAPLCPPVIEPGASCQVAVRFAPAFSGGHAGTLIVDTSAATPATVALSGSAFVPADAVVSPTAIDFGLVELGRSSPPVPVTLTNPGSLPLILGKLQTFGDYSATADCPAQLGPSASCTISVIFKPSGLSELGGQLVIESNGVHSPLWVPLIGRSFGSIIDLNVGALDFGAVTVGAASEPRTVTVRNAGNTALALSGLVPVGEGAAAWRIADDACSGQTLQPLATCTFAVLFQPGRHGALRGSIAVSDVSGLPTIDLPLAGQGEPGSVLEIPTLSEVGLVLLVLLLAGAGMITLRGRTA